MSAMTIRVSVGLLSGEKLDLEDRAGNPGSRWFGGSLDFINLPMAS